MNKYNKCPVCSSSRAFMFLERTNVPVHQNLVFKDRESAINIPRGDLKFFCCEECGFIFNNAFDPSKLMYGSEYDNTQIYSPHFRNYIRSLINYLIYEKKIHNFRIVEVGCGKGYFIRELIMEDESNIGYGFDPAYEGPENEFNGRLRFERRFYGTDCTDIQADVIICRHVIEHIPNPKDLLYSIRQALKNSPKAQIFFETPCVEWILINKVFWDFFYEHCSLFSADSIRTLMEVAGFKVNEVKRLFGNQYLWVEAELYDNNPIIYKNSGNITILAQEFGNEEEILVNTWKAKVSELARNGKIAIWGVGAKGVTFLNLIDPKCELIICAVDMNPKKQGGFVPGTGHPILNYQDLKKEGITHVILMNPNYSEKVLEILKQSNLDVKVIVNL